MLRNSDIKSNLNSDMSIHTYSTWEFLICFSQPAVLCLLSISGRMNRPWASFNWPSGAPSCAFIAPHEDRKNSQNTDQNQQLAPDHPRLRWCFFPNLFPFGLLKKTILVQAEDHLGHEVQFCPSHRPGGFAGLDLCHASAGANGAMAARHGLCTRPGGGLRLRAKPRPGKLASLDWSLWFIRCVWQKSIRHTVKTCWNTWNLESSRTPTPDIWLSGATLHHAIEMFQAGLVENPMVFWCHQSFQYVNTSILHNTRWKHKILWMPENWKRKATTKA